MRTQTAHAIQQKTKGNELMFRRVNQWLSMVIPGCTLALFISHASGSCAELSIVVPL
jgi:hypothetical protein